MKIDEDILKDIILANWEEDDLKYNGGPLYDIQLSHISIYFRLSPNGGYYALDTNTYKMMLREKKLGELLP